MSSRSDILSISTSPSDPARPRQNARYPLLELAVCTLVTLVVFGGLLAWYQHNFWTQQQHAEALADMQRWRGQLLLLDEVLTMSARMAVSTGKTSWIDRYERSEPLLNEALGNLQQVAARYGAVTGTLETDEANSDLVAMERAAFTALARGERAEASQLLFGPAYLSLKKSYSDGMQTLLQRMDQEQAVANQAGVEAGRWMAATTLISLVFLLILWWQYAGVHRRWRENLARRSRSDIAELDKERKKGQHLRSELTLTEQRLEFILSNSPLIVFAISAQGIFEYSNGAGLEDMNLKAGEVVGQSVWTLYGHLPVMIANVKLALNGNSRRYEGENELGRHYETFLYPVARDDGRYDVVGVALDITESAKARKTAAMLGDVLQHSPVGTAWIDAKGHYKYVNEGFCQITGFQQADLLNNPWQTALRESTSDKQMDGLRADLLDEPGLQQTTELQVSRSDGQTRWLKARAVARRMGRETGVILAVEDITELRQTQSELTERTYSDAGTGLPNRLAMVEWLTTVLMGSARDRASTGALVYIDLDHFRRIHDVLGRGVAEQFLGEVASRLLDQVPAGGMLARSGGDEFLLYLPATSRDSVEDLVQLVKGDLEIPFDFSGNEFTISASFGAAMLPLDAGTAGEALRCAEAAMYVAKQRGRKCLSFFQAELAENPKRLLQIETRLRAAIRAEQLEVHYQPIMRLADRSVTGGEALLRWTDAELGAVSPAEFIPVAEELNLTSELTRLVINAAVSDAARWNKQLGRKLRVAINCSAQQLDEPDFCDLLVQTLRSRGLQPAQFELEVTERVVMSQSSQVSDTISRLLAAGFRLSIDDFGTGYSALAYLKRYPFHTVKIDRSFIRDITNRPADEALCRAIIGIAEALHMDTVAEGLESRDQVESLSGLGSEYGQGFYFAEALPSDRFVEWVRIRDPAGRITA